MIINKNYIFVYNNDTKFSHKILYVENYTKNGSKMDQKEQTQPDGL